MSSSKFQVSSFNTHLPDLLRISHDIGRDPWLVQAGGGNTSIKLPDGETMLIKASGTYLADMSEDRGWLTVSRSAVDDLFAESALRELPAAERESQVLQRLYDAVVGEGGERPSVETPLHHLLGPVVMHSHAVAANALTCNVDGESQLRELAAGDALPPLWIPYIDPGSPLAFDIHDRIVKYKGVHGDAPDVLFLENHGFFCAADTADECIALHAQWMERLNAFFAPGLPVEGHPEISAGDQAIVRDGVARAATAWDGAEPIVRCSAAPELLHAAHHDCGKVFTGGLTPDHVVYNGPCALFLSAEPDAAEIAVAIAAYKEKHGIPPKLLLQPQRGLYIVCPTEKQVEAAEALALSAVRLALLAHCRVRCMTARDVDYIMNWEVEHYRAKLIEAEG